MTTTTTEPNATAPTEGECPCAFWAPTASSLRPGSSDGMATTHDWLLRAESWTFDDFAALVTGLFDHDLEGVEVGTLADFAGQHNWKDPRTVYDLMAGLDRLTSAEVAAQVAEEANQVLVVQRDAMRRALAGIEAAAGVGVGLGRPQ